MSDKLCKRCSTIKPRDLFTVSKSHSDGLQSYCKACYAERRMTYAKNNPEKCRKSCVASIIKHKEKVALRKKEYRLNNAEKVKASRKASYEKNKNKELAGGRKYKRNHKERLSALQSEWCKNNKPITRYRRSMRRAAEKQATPSWANVFFIKEAYDLAVLRSKMTGVPHDVDHIVPLQSKLVCGLHWEGNLRVITASENRQKLNTYWPDMPIAI